MSPFSSTPIIQLTHVHKYFGALHILKDVSLQITPGQLVVLIGPSGCGKTTLLRCLNGLESINQGQLIVNGTDLTRSQIDWNRFRSEIGMVFQQFNLFPHLTVLQNITLAPIKVKGLPRDVAETSALSLLESVGLKEKARVYPSQLSGGQQQRVAIVRSLAMDPTIMLLDEPTSALDPVMTREVLSVIQEITAQRKAAQSPMTTVMVTHEMHFAQSVADWVVFLNAGHIVEEGLPEHLFLSPREVETQQFLASLNTPLSV